MKLCKACGKLMAYNSYFGGHICSCGEEEREKRSYQLELGPMNDDDDGDDEIKKREYALA